MRPRSINDPHRGRLFLHQYGSVLLWALGVRCLLAANPVMPGADPHALAVGNTVWIYPTWSDSKLERFFAFSSTNFTHWQRHGPVLDFKDVTWIKDDGQERHNAWAPSVLVKDVKYYFYYSVGPQNPTPSRIGVAIGDGPEGSAANTACLPDSKGPWNTTSRQNWPMAKRSLGRPQRPTCVKPSSPGDGKMLSGVLSSNSNEANPRSLAAYEYSHNTALRHSRAKW